MLGEVKRLAGRPLPTVGTKRLAAPKPSSSASEEADRFARTVFRPKRGGRVALRDIRSAYHSWCASAERTPLADDEIAKALNDLFASVDLRIIWGGWRRRRRGD